MHSATASVGVAVNDMLPQITLTPFTGTQANSLGAMFGPGTYFWSLVGSATQTVFDMRRAAAQEARR